MTVQHGITKFHIHTIIPKASEVRLCIYLDILHIDPGLNLLTFSL